MANLRRRVSGLIATGLVVVVSASTAPIAAQVEPPTNPAPAVPSVRILKGSLVSPAAAASYYTSAVATDGLCRDFGPSGLRANVAEICPSGGRPRDPEIIELARGLRNDPDLIYEYVRNRIDTDFLFGSHKGALGVVIDGSGTPFDQARLLVELLRQAGFSSSYRYGTVALTGAQFTEWTGLSQAKAACEFLATAGFPATINGSSPSNCALSGAVNSVVLSHVWVQTQISGQTVFMDPSIKSYLHQTTLPTLQADMGLTPGAAGNAARAGMTQGTLSSQSYISNLNASGLASNLDARASALLARVRQAPTSGQRDLRGGDIADLVGGRRLTSAERPTGGWRQTQPSTYVTQSTWTNIPDVLRARLTIHATRPLQSSTTTVFSAVEFFVDEIYGRRLEIGSVQKPCSTQADPGCELSAYAPQLSLDGVALLTAGSVSEYALVPLDITLTANHPFAASAGAFADAAIEKKAEFLSPMTIVHGWGATSGELGNKWAREQGLDPDVPATQSVTDTSPAPSPDGSLIRARVAAAWLAQFSRARDLHAELANSRQVHFHSLGLVSAAQTRAYTLQPHATDAGQPIPDLPDGFNVADESIVLDVETTFGLVNRAGSAAARRAALHAIAATGAALEGSVLEQLTSSPDAASTARRLAWGNAPEAGETPATASRRVYLYQGTASSAQVTSTLVAENLSSGLHGSFTPSGGPAQQPLPTQVPEYMRGRLSSTISNYLALGYDVVASNEAMLGPGHRHGAELLVQISSGGIDPISDPSYVYERAPSLQVGGAIIASHYDAAGDPDFIAHTLTRYGAISKGAGSGTGDPAAFDPARPADSLKDSWIDRSTALGVNLSSGSAGYTSPVLHAVGQGDFPYKIESRLELRGAGLAPLDERSQYPQYGQDGVVSNWEVFGGLGSSGMEAMGEGRIEATLQTVAAFAAMQDIWLESPSAARETIGALIADWWGRTIVFNTATVSRGGTPAQYLRLADGVYVAPTGGGRLEIAGTPRAERPYAHFVGRFPQDSSQREALDRVWNMSTVQLRAYGAHGDVQRLAAIGTDPVSPLGGLMASGPKRKLWTFRLADWTFPEGVVLTATYAEATRGITPTAIASNLGYQLTLPSGQTTVCASPVCVGVADAAGGIHRVGFNNMAERTVSARPQGSSLLAAIYSPRSATVAATAFTYDAVGRVKEARDGIAVATPAVRGAHQFFIAEGYRGERQDPLGGRYSVETHEGGRRSRHTDEVGRVTVARMDGRGRLLSRTSPWGDTTSFGYDGRDNVTELTRSPRAGCGTDPHWCQTSVVTATYHATWNKPVTVTLPATGPDAQSASTWTFAYDNQGRLITRTGPVVSDGLGGTGQAVWSTLYDAFGRVRWTRDPVGIEARMVYGTNNAGPCLTAQYAADQSSGFRQTTQFTCNATGDVTSVTDARLNVTTFTYDALRRKKSEVGPTSTGIHTQWDYDLDGNQIAERRWDATASLWRAVTTTYSLTNTPLTVTDPAGDVTRTCYDALDRATVAVDPTGRATRTAYNLAGQPTLVERWFTASLTDATCALTQAREPHLTTNRWRGMEYNLGGLQSAEIDGNGNRTTMDYDGLGRLMRTTFADAKFIQTVRNERDQVVITTKRSGDLHQAFFDAMGRVDRVWEHRPAAAYPEGRITRTSFDLASRTVWTDVSTQTTTTFDNALLRDIRTYGYDPVGRVQYDRVTPNGTMGSTQQVLTYVYDPTNNRTSIQWPDGYTATYRYDAANRADRVTFGTHQADIALDSLSRRTGLTRSNGVNSTYAYETDNDLSQINTAWAPAAGQTAAIYGFQHDAAGRITGLGINRPDLEWAPTLAYAQTYGAPTNLNQTTSRNGVPLDWDDNGNLDSYGTPGNPNYRDYEWTWGNRLAEVHGPGTDTYYGYDSQDRRTSMIEDGTMTRTLWSGADEVGEYTQAGVLVRRFIPDGSGSMDARLATVNPDNTIHWHHTDHQGSVIATSNAAGQAAGFTNYSPHGEFGTGASAPPPGSPFGYTGRQWDAQAKLYQYRARYYLPEAGIFLSVDPIGTKDDPNLYLYVGQDPVNATDPTGMIQDRPTDSITRRREERSLRDGIDNSNGAPSAPPVRIVGGDSYERGQAQTAIGAINSTQDGRDMFQDARERGTSATIQFNDDGYQGASQLTNVVNIDANHLPDIQLSDGLATATVTDVLIHELPHVLLDSEDSGVDSMDNVRDNENPIRRQLGLRERVAY